MAFEPGKGPPGNVKVTVGKPKKRKRTLAAPTPDQQDRAAANRTTQIKQSKPIAGDAPQTRAADNAKADKYKQSNRYINQVQTARGDAHPTKVLQSFGRSHTATGREAQRYADSQYFQRHTRVSAPTTTPTAPDKTPTRFEVDPSTGAARIVRKPQPGKHPVFAAPPKPKADQPRTDQELRKYLKDGKRPYSVDQLHPKEGVIVAPTRLATSLFFSKETAKPLHAVVGGLEGKNVVKSFKGGTDTGSDLLKHYKLDKKLHLGKIGTFAGGELLNLGLDPFNHLKLSAMSPKEALERKANRIETKAGVSARPVREADAKAAARVDDVRASAARASTHRGVQAGVVGGIPLTHHRFHLSTKGHATARVAGHPAAQAAARFAHDNPASQAIGRAFVPHFRDKTVPKPVHERDVHAQRKRTHAFHTADRQGANRAHALKDAAQEAHQHDTPEDITAAIEHAPKGPTPEFQDFKLRSQEHKDLTAAKRKERTAKGKTRAQQGRTNFETNQENTALRRKLADKVRLRDNAVDAGDVKNMSHADAVTVHAGTVTGIADETATIKALEKRGVNRTAKEAVALKEARQNRKALVKQKAAIESKWSTNGALKPVDASIRDLEAEAAPLEAKVRTPGVRLTADETKRLSTARRRLGAFQREKQHVEIEPAIRGYMKASGAAKDASIEHTDARKAYRNAHGKDPSESGMYPRLRPPKLPVVGARELFTDTERAAAAQRFHDAHFTHLDAQRGRLDAIDKLETAAEKQASRHAGGEPGASPLRLYDRRNPSTIARTESARGMQQAATAERKAAEDKALGKKNPATGLREGGVKEYTTEFRERVPTTAGNVKPGKTWRAFLDGLNPAERHSPADLHSTGRAIAVQHEREVNDLKVKLQKAGLLNQDVPEHYLHHMDSQAITNQLAADQKKFGVKAFRNQGRAAKTGLLKTRDDQRPIKTQHEHSGMAIDRWETHVDRIDANYLRNGNRALADAEYLRALREDVGTPLTAHARKNMTDTEGVYAVRPDGISRVNEHDTDAALRGEPVAKGDHVILPKAIGEREINVRDGNFKPSIFGKAADEFHRFWKTGVTVLDLPLYQERNTYDDTLRFWYGDGDFPSYRDAWKAMHAYSRMQKGQKSLVPGGLSGATIKIGRERMPMTQFLKEAEEDGIPQGGRYAAEFEHVGDKVQLPTEQGPLRSLGRAGNDKIRNAGSFMESGPRMATYLSARRRGMTREQATTWTRIHHFDYTEITNSERTLRRFIPFWTFTSRNTTLQARTLLTRPGKMSQFEAFREEAAKLAGLQPGWDSKYLDSTQQKALPIPVRVGTAKDGTPNIKLIYPSFSNTDLNRIPVPVGGKNMVGVAEDEAQMLMQQVTPLAKDPLELLLNHSFFFNQGIYQGGITHDTEAPKWVPAPSWAKSIPGLKKYVTSIKGPDGKMTDGWPAALDYMLKTFPQTGLVTTAFVATANNRGQTAKDRIATQGLGVRITGFDSNRGEEERLRNRISSLTNTRTNLKTNNKQADPKADQFASKRYQSLTDQIRTSQAKLDKLTGKKATDRVLPRPKTIDQQVQDKVKNRLKSTTPSAIDKQVKRKLQRIGIETGSG